MWTGLNCPMILFLDSTFCYGYWNFEVYWQRILLFILPAVLLPFSQYVKYSTYFRLPFPGLCNAGKVGGGWRGVSVTANEALAVVESLLIVLCSVRNIRMSPICYV